MPYTFRLCVYMHTSLFSGTTRCFRLIVYFSCSSPRLIFFQEAVAPFIREWYSEAKLWMLGVLVATWCHCFWAHSVDREVGNIRMYTNLCIHTYLRLFLCIKVGLHLYLCDSSWICLDPTIFANRLDIECEKRVVKDDSKVLAWEPEGWRCEDCGQSRFLGRVQEFFPRLAKCLRCLIDMLIGLSSQQLNKWMWSSEESGLGWIHASCPYRWDQCLKSECW